MVIDATNSYAYDSITDDKITCNAMLFSRGISAMRMNFLGSTDFFGRICIYKLDVIGYPV